MSEWRQEAEERECPGDLADLPNGWEYRPLAKLVDEKRGICYGIVQPGSHTTKGIPIVRVNNIKAGRIDTSDVLRVAEHIESRYSRSRLRGGEVLLTLVGSLGESAIVPPELEGWNVARAVGVIPVIEEIGPRWVELCLRSSGAQHFIRTRATTTVQATFNLRDVAMLPIPVPPKEERETIARVLGALDDKIELNRRMNETLEAMARAIFQSWFVDFDPVQAKHDGRKPSGMSTSMAVLFPATFEDSSLGPIPKGWQVTRLKDLTSKIGSGATPHGGSSVYVESGVALIRSQNVHDHDFRWNGLARLTDRSAAELNGVEVKVGDVLLNITGDSILRTCVVDPSVLPARVNQHVAIIRAVDSVPSRYLHLYLVQPRIKGFLLGLNAGATRPAITKGHLESVLVLRPSPAVLAAFSASTTPIFRQIEANRSQSRTLATLRDTLLPTLLNGNVRLNH